MQTVDGPVGGNQREKTWLFMVTAAQDKCLHAPGSRHCFSEYYQLPCEEGVIDPVLQRRKLRFREIRYLGQGYRELEFKLRFVSQACAPNHLSMLPLFRKHLH